MAWWISAGVLILLLLVFFFLRRREPRVVQLPSPDPRRLGPGESAAGKQALTRALELILAAKWDPLRNHFWRETEGSREALNFVDRAIRKHADFGVYGNLTAGIEALAQAGCTVGVKETREGYSVHVDPIDGHGHFHHFEVFKDGRVGESACGHYEPMPEEDWED